MTRRQREIKRERADAHRRRQNDRRQAAVTAATAAAGKSSGRKFEGGMEERGYRMVSGTWCRRP